MSLEAFHDYWQARHAPLVREVSDALNIVRYVQCHSFSHPQGLAVAGARGNGVEPYDGVAELWWRSFEEILQAGSTSQGRAATRLLLEDERRFIDLAQSPLFFVREHEIFAAG